MFIQASEIGTALIYRKKKVAAVNYRITSLSETIYSLTNAFSRLDDPKGSVINNLLTRSVNDTIAIETELAEFNTHNTTININTAEMLLNEDEEDLDPEIYRQDINSHHPETHHQPDPAIQGIMLTA